METYSTYLDAELVQMLRQGDRLAFEVIYRRFLPALYDATYKRLKQKEQTEDILQEVFARLWAKRESLDIAELGAYLRVSARNAAINYITRNKTVLSFYEPFEAMLLESTGADAPLIARELMELVLAYADTLPEKKREILLLHVQNKLSTREIAEKLGISQKTVQNQLRQALTGLKEHLTPFILAILVHHL